MVTATIQKAVELGRRLGQVFVATADRGGMPHVASAGRLRALEGRQVEVAAWLCPGTVSNLQQNRLIALVVWEAGTDTGYQLLGEVEKITDTAMLDGYAPELDKKPSPPQTERTLRVRIDRVFSFSQAPHSDLEE